MATTPAPPSIIVIKKKKNGHGGHHGGAWKVAYADFVTAMMALFIVLWLLSSSEETKKAIGGYFQDPTGVGKQIGTTQFGSGEGLTLKKDDMEKLKEKLQDAIKQVPELQKMKNQVQMIVTGEGLRIELIETEKGMFFDSGSANPSAKGKEVLAVLAGELGKLPNRILVEGHTDAKPFNSSGGYGNWELSTERANAARRWMQISGLRPSQVAQVRGFADQSLRNPKDPEDASNRRISVIIQYQNATKIPDKKPEPAANAGVKKAEAKKEH
ncbi:MAG: flagellar motor protein MotB [Bryobacteraceae bacterium]